MTESLERIGHRLHLVDVALVRLLSEEQQRGAASAAVFSHRTMGRHLGRRATQLRPNLGRRCRHSSAVLQALVLAQVQVMVHRPHARLTSDDA